MSRGKLLLIRGCSGSGKTTIAEKAYSSFVSCCADDYFTDKEGKYKFDGTKIQLAHDQCYNKCVKSLSNGKNVVVHNTFTRISEMQRYLDLKNIADIKIYRIIANFGSTKNVPLKAINAHIDNYEKHPNDVNIKFDMNTNKIYPYKELSPPYFYLSQQSIEESYFGYSDGYCFINSVKYFILTKELFNKCLKAQKSGEKIDVKYSFELQSGKIIRNLIDIR